MERLEYRSPARVGGLVSVWSLIFVGLAVVVVGALTLRHSGILLIVLGVVGLVLLVGYVLPLIATPLVVTDAGIHGFMVWRRMLIPWSSVRSFEVRDPRGRDHPLSVVVVHLNNGKQFTLGFTGGTAEHANGIAEQLRQAHSQCSG
jgi:hypothetical protein